MFDETGLAVLLTMAIALISLGTNLIREGQILEGVVVVLLGLIIIVVYFTVIQPQYMKRRFGLYVQN